MSFFPHSHRRIDKGMLFTKLTLEKMRCVSSSERLTAAATVTRLCRTTATFCQAWMGVACIVTRTTLSHSLRNYHPHSHTVTLRHYTHTQSIDAINNLLPVTVVSRELRLTSNLCKKEWYKERKMMVQKKA